MKRSIRHLWSHNSSEVIIGMLRNNINNSIILIFKCFVVILLILGPLYIHWFKFFIFYWKKREWMFKGSKMPLILIIIHVVFSFILIVSVSFANSPTISLVILIFVSPALSLFVEFNVKKIGDLARAKILLAFLWL